MNIDQIFTSVKNSNQSQSSKYFPESSIDLEDKNILSTFDNMALKKVTRKSTSTHWCSTSNSVKSNIYFYIPPIENDTTSDSFISSTHK